MKPNKLLFIFCISVFIIASISFAVPAPTKPAKKTTVPVFTLHSFAFENLGTIPKKYANTGINGGENISLPMFWTLAPKAVKSYAISMTDLSANNFAHWLVVNIPPGTNSIDEGASMTNMPDGSYEMMNGFESIGYGGPEPPLWSGKHTYIITLYALNTSQIKLKREATYQDMLKAIEGKVISKASLSGVFSRF